MVNQDQQWALARRRVSRRSLLGAAAAAPAGLLLAGCGDRPLAAAGGPDAEVTYLTSFGQLGRDSYAYLALEAGYFAEQRLRVSVEPGSGVQPNLQALLAGQAQFVVCDMAGAAIVADSGTGGFTAICAIQQLALSAVMAVDPHIGEPADLEGRQVGLPAGAVTELLLPAWLEKAGVDVGAVVQVPMGPADLVPALSSGQVDAIGQFVVGKPLVAAATGKEPTVLPYSDHLFDLFGIGLHTTTELVATSPDLCLRFQAALLAGLEHALRRPQDAAAALAAHVPEINPEVAAAEMELMLPYAQVPAGQLGEVDRSRVARQVALLQSAGAIEAWVEPEQLVAFELVPGGGGS